MTTQNTRVPERVSTWVRAWLSKKNSQKETDWKIEPLAGDGSLRCYFRVKLESMGTSLVLLSDPQWICSKDYAPHQVYLSSHNIPVPRFIEIDVANGIGVMEDLGDELLQDRLRTLETAPEKKFQWLDKACRLLADLQGKTFPVLPSLPVATRRFDAQKYFEELLFTEEHLCQKFLHQSPASILHLQVIRDYCTTLQSILPDTFSHRDYHTRNLLVCDDRLYMIDFQDARLGPVQYDLASLLFDAYVPLSMEERGRLLEGYKEALRQYPLFQKIVWDTFESDLWRIALQRTVKAAGSFASFFTRYGKRTYLPYLVPALESALTLQRLCYSPDHPLNRALEISEWITKTSSQVSACASEETP